MRERLYEAKAIVDAVNWILLLRWLIEEARSALTTDPEPLQWQWSPTPPALALTAKMTPCESLFSLLLKLTLLSLARVSCSSDVNQLLPRLPFPPNSSLIPSLTTGGISTMLLFTESRDLSTRECKSALWDRTLSSHNIIRLTPLFPAFDSSWKYGRTSSIRRPVQSELRPKATQQLNVRNPFTLEIKSVISARSLIRDSNERVLSQSIWETTKHPQTSPPKRNREQSQPRLPTRGRSRGIWEKCRV